MLVYGNAAKTMVSIIGIMGGIGSGKDIAAEYIAEKLSIPRYEISQPLKDIARERKIDATRGNLVELGTQIAKERGADFLIKSLLRKVSGTAIVTGMRQLPQINYLRQHVKLILIAIEAEPTIRFHRAQAREKQGEATTVEKFIQREQAENSGDHAQRLFECMKLADYHIENNLALELLFRAIDTVLKQEQLL